MGGSGGRKLIAMFLLGGLTSPALASPDEEIVPKSCSNACLAVGIDVDKGEDGGSANSSGAQASQQKAICDSLKESMGDAFDANRCESCTSQAAANQGAPPEIARSHCQAIRMQYSTRKRTKPLIYAYGLATAACGTLCACEIASAGTCTTISGVGCTAAGAGALGFEIYQNLGLASEFDQYQHDFLAMGGGAVGTAGGAVATLGTQSSTISNISSCVSAGVFAVMTGLKWNSLSSRTGDIQRECSAVESYSGLDTLVSDVSACMTERGGGSGGSFSSGLGKAQAPGRSSRGGANGETAEEVLAAANKDIYGTGGVSAAAVDGKMGDFYQQQIDANALKKFAKDTNLTPDRFQKEMASGGMGGMLANMGVPENVAKKLGEISDSARRASVKTLGSAYSSGGGASAGDSQEKKAPPRRPFRGFASGPTAAGGEVDFGQKRPDTGYDAGDVYHSQWKGSIFEIIDYRMKQGARDRVEKKPWFTPYNRFITSQPDSKK